MMHTNYHNASGLPDDRQITTARDQAMLARAHAGPVPQILSAISRPGASSIAARRCATTTTCSAASTASTASRPAISAIPASTSPSMCTATSAISWSVVFGGRTAGARDAHVRSLIDSNITVASAKRTAPPVVEGWRSQDQARRARRLCRRRRRPSTATAEATASPSPAPPRRSSRCRSRPCSVQPAADAHRLAVAAGAREAASSSRAGHRRPRRPSPPWRLSSSARRCPPAKPGALAALPAKASDAARPDHHRRRGQSA